VRAGSGGESSKLMVAAGRAYTANTSSSLLPTGGFAARGEEPSAPPWPPREWPVSGVGKPNGNVPFRLGIDCGGMVGDRFAGEEAVARTGLGGGLLGAGVAAVPEPEVAVTAIEARGGMELDLVGEMRAASVSCGTLSTVAHSGIPARHTSERSVSL
jgi:hypothetical protein